MEVTAAPVPYVQEIAKALTIVPERYVRPVHEHPILSNSTPLPEIPVIDLSKLLSQDHKEHELERLHYACKEWGFFQGVDSSLVEKVKRGAQGLFDLTMEEKKKFGQREGEAEGYGQLFMVLEEQKLKSGHICFSCSLCHQIRKDGLWIPVKPLPNAFIINLGDMLEVMSNGIYQSIEHGATVNSEKERLSIATFYSTAIDAIICLAPSFVTPKTPAMFKPISVGDYFKGYLAQEICGKYFLVTLTRNQTALILIHHGESLWNEKNLFIGCVDVLLSKKGIDEAIEAGKRISSIPSEAGVYAYTRLAMGKLCLAEGKLAKHYIPLFVQELEESKFAALQNMRENQGLDKGNMAEIDGYQNLFSLMK
ncbi:Protein SRG1 [Glycine max]|nr:Protein SRG1 [Glycine max]